MRRFLVLLVLVWMMVPARRGAAQQPEEEYPGYVVRDRVLVKYRGQDREVIIPPKLGIDRIGERAFAGSPITSVVIPQGVGFIGERAFAGCPFLKTVRLPNTLAVLGRRAFFNCFSLETINIPRTLRTIEDGAFFNCRGLVEMDIPDTLKSIGSRAFSGCGGMRKLALSRRTVLGEHPFMGVPPKSIVWKD